MNYYYTYVLKSLSTGKRYIGQTSNLKHRILAHNEGLSRYTKARGPWQLIHNESFELRSEAIQREKFLKSGKGREFLNSLTE